MNGTTGATSVTSCPYRSRSGEVGTRSPSHATSRVRPWFFEKKIGLGFRRLLSGSIYIVPTGNRVERLERPLSARE